MTQSILELARRRMEIYEEIGYATCFSDNDPCDPGWWLGLATTMNEVCVFEALEAEKRGLA